MAQNTLPSLPTILIILIYLPVVWNHPPNQYQYVRIYAIHQSKYDLLHYLSTCIDFTSWHRDWILPCFSTYEPLWDFMLVWRLVWACHNGYWQVEALDSTLYKPELRWYNVCLYSNPSCNKVLGICTTFPSYSEVLLNIIQLFKCTIDKL